MTHTHGVVLDQRDGFPMPASPIPLDWGRQAVGLNLDGSGWDPVTPWMVVAPPGTRQVEAVARLHVSGGTCRATLYRRPKAGAVTGDADAQPSDVKLDVSTGTGTLKLHHAGECYPGDGLFILLEQVSGSVTVLNIGPDNIRTLLSVQFL